MTEIAVRDTARDLDGCFTGGDTDTLIHDVSLVVLARSPQRQSIRVSRHRSMRLERRFLP
ncbi:conserved hypothetical protein [Burkholderia orbicola]